ncbi:uncharacterized protein LOC133900294 [Phragmites australis]|uniref:uncharacterized protein LOC133900294 n=1 Tax=Phragmites australis TaxID=29695 RepID=UPI002D78CD45|nr:uncharacterized protein LOC133900294 [Phragmites australis]
MRPPPDRPTQNAAVRLLLLSRTPKLGKGGSAQSRLAMLHSLAHTESWAVDLSWDIVARFGARMQIPREFFDDFVRVAQDEGWHCIVLSAWLRELGSHYGDRGSRRGRRIRSLVGSLFLVRMEGILRTSKYRKLYKILVGEDF